MQDKPTMIRRVCPLCTCADQEEVVTLKQEDFTIPNTFYRLEKLDELGLDAKRTYPIVKCLKCGMIYSRYHLDDQTEDLVYNQLIDSDLSLKKVLTISRRKKDLKHWLDLLSLVEEAMPGQIDLKVMDYGCGFGTLLLAARGPGVEVVGFDVTEWKVTWARDQGLTVCTRVEDLRAYAPFDICISTSVLEHLRYPRDAVTEMTSLLKPGGYALISCVLGSAAEESDWDNIKKRLSQGRPLPKEINPWEHLNYFTFGTLSSLLSEFGLVPAATPNRSSGLYDLAQFLKNFRKFGIGIVQKNQRRRVVPQYWQFRGSISD